MIANASSIAFSGSNGAAGAASRRLNARIRRRWLTGKVLTGVIGEAADLTYR